MAEPARHLHVIDSETGEQLDGCPSCQYKQDTIEGLDQQINSLAAKLRELQRDKEKEAQQNPLWPVALEVFKVWRIVCNHPRAAWNWQRFEAVVGVLAEKQYGKTLEDRKMLAYRAIVGARFDCFKVKRANGSWRRFDEFERIFKNFAATEEFANKAPKDWQERLVNAVPGLVLMEVAA